MVFTTTYKGIDGDVVSDLTVKNNLNAVALDIQSAVAGLLQSGSNKVIDI
jgi:hypothetical protein